MNRSLTLKMFTDPKTGSLAMSVTHAEVDGSEDAVEKHSVSGTDFWGSDPAMTEAANRAIADFLGRLRTDAKRAVSPIEKAARG